MRHHLPLLVALALIGVAASAPARRAAGAAQASTTLGGVARDESGAVLPGVTVTLTLENGAVVRTVVTDASGQFRFSDIAPGTYRVEASFAGFARVVRTGIVVTGSATQSLSLEFRTGGGVARRARPRPRAPAPAPPPPPPPAVRRERRPPAPSPAPSADDGKATVPVFYATDRERLPRLPLGYSGVRNPSGTLDLGRFDVHVPRDHKLGSVERPTIWTLYREDPEKHLVITSRTLQSYDEFYADIQRVVARSSRKDAFVFVHGFNVAFEDAVFRTAQLAYDLGFDGAPILYSWPSEARLSPIGYTTDEANNEWTVPHLRWFLEDVARMSGATRVHLIAHSMGNRALVNALERMGPSAAKRFNEVVLTAPDIDASTFVQLADAVRRNAQMATLYASSNDAALAASKKLHGAYPRAGESGASLVVVPGIDTVDVSAVDTNLIGHFYYGDNSSVISDMFLLITQGLPPAQRPRLQGTGTPPRRHWLFRP